MVAHHTHTRTHAYTHIRRHICSQMLAQCERQARQGRSDILGPIRSRSSDLAYPLPSVQEKVINLYLLAHWSDLFARHYSQSSSDVSTNLGRGHCSLRSVGHSQKIAHVIKRGMITNLLLEFWYQIQHNFEYSARWWSISNVIVFSCWRQQTSLLQ